MREGTLRTTCGEKSRLHDIAWEFSSTLRTLREDAGLSMAELADAAGLSRQMLHGLETGTKHPSLETAERIAIALGKKLRVFEGCGIQVLS